MTEEPEFCEECSFYLEPGWKGITCIPCGAKVCSRQCLADHKVHCYAVIEKRERAYPN